MSDLIVITDRWMDGVKLQADELHLLKPEAISDCYNDLQASHLQNLGRANHICFTPKMVVVCR